MKKNQISAIGPSLPCVVLAWVHSVLLFFGFYPLFADISGLTGGSFLRYTALGVLLLIPAASSWLLLKKIRFVILYVLTGFFIALALGLLSGCLAAGAFSYSMGITTAFTFFVSMLMFCVHTAARLRHGELKNDFLAAHGDVAEFELEVWEVPNFLSSPSPAALLWFASLYLVGALVKLTRFWHVAFYLTLMEIFVCFMYRCLFSFTDFLQKNHKSANIPVSTIRRVHKLFFIAALLLLSVCVLPSVAYQREPLSTLKEKEIHFEIEEEQGYDSPQYIPPSVSVEEMLEEMDAEVTEFPRWVGILVQVFLWSLVAVAASVFLAGIIRSIRNAILDFHVEDEDEIIFLDSEEADTHTALREPKKKEGFLSVNAQIRRRYKKAIKKATTGTPAAWATPTELESDAGLFGTPSMTELHALYEKARYSMNGCTREDLRQ